jgi:membrane protein implicated in regulation of membrane protease activity
MKLNALQWAWMSAAAIFVASLLLDLANIVNVPPIYMLLCSTLLVVVGWRVMPSIKELEQPQRRRS